MPRHIEGGPAPERLASKEPYEKAREIIALAEDIGEDVDELLEIAASLIVDDQHSELVERLSRIRYRIIHEGCRLAGVPDATRTRASKNW